KSSKSSAKTTTSFAGGAVWATARSANPSTPTAPTAPTNPTAAIVVRMRFMAGRLPDLRRGVDHNPGCGTVRGEEEGILAAYAASRSRTGVAPIVRKALPRSADRRTSYLAVI